MTTTEASEAKRKAEEEILKILKNLQKETDCDVCAAYAEIEEVEPGCGFLYNFEITLHVK